MNDHPDMATPIRRMICCCCGAVTSGRQWHNRDAGFGLCVDCVDYCAKGGTPADFESCYGVRGVHFDVQVSQ
jgi:hypothetical protein